MQTYALLTQTRNQLTHHGGPGCGRGHTRVHQQRRCHKRLSAGCAGNGHNSGLHLQEKLERWSVTMLCLSCTLVMGRAELMESEKTPKLPTENKIDQSWESVCLRLGFCIIAALLSRFQPAYLSPPSPETHSHSTHSYNHEDGDRCYGFVLPGRRDSVCGAVRIPRFSARPAAAGLVWYVCHVRVQSSHVAYKSACAT